MSFLQKMAAIQKAHAALVTQIQSQPGLDAAARDERLKAAGAERDNAITLLASQPADDLAGGGKSVGVPCEQCAAGGVRSRTNRCAARPVGVACGADTFRCRNCPPRTVARGVPAVCALLHSGFEDRQGEFDE